MRTSFDTCLIPGTESAGQRTVNVQHTDDAAIVDQRHNQFRI